MTAAAGERFAGLSRRRPRARPWWRELREQGLIAARPRTYTHAVPYSHRSGERDRAADLAAVVHAHGRAGRAGDRGRRASGRVRFHPDAGRARLPRLDGEHPAVVHLPPAVVGPPAAGLVLRRLRGDLRRHRARPTAAERLEHRTRTCSTRGSPARCGRSRRWAGPSDTPELRAFYPTDVLVTARDIIFLWVARMIMMGLEFTGEIPFADVYVHSVIQAPDGRRMSKSLGTGIDPLELIEAGRGRPCSRDGGEFPAYGADAVRCGLLGDVLRPGRPLQRGEGRPGPAARQQALERGAASILTRVDEGVRAARRRRSAVEDRWILSRLAARASRDRCADRALRLLARRAGALRLRLRRALRLVPGAGQAAPVRRRAGQPRATLLHVLQRTLALAHPMIPFVTEEICGYMPGARGPARAPVRAREPSPLDDARRGGARARDRGVQALRGWRDVAGVRPGRTLHARLAAEGYEQTAALLARLGRLELDATQAGDPVATVPVPGGAIEILASDELDLGAAERKRERAPRTSSRRRSSGPSASSPTRASWPRRRRRSSRPSARSWRAGAERERSVRLAQLGWTPERGRALPALARAVRHALRPGPHAPPDDRAGAPRAPLRLDPRRRHERQVLDDADDRRDPRAPRAAHRRLPVAAPGLASPSASGSASATSSRRRFAAAVARAARAAELVDRRRRAERRRHAVRGC